MSNAQVPGNGPDRKEKRFQSHISLMLTRRCNVRCRHCCVESLPAHASRGDIAEADLYDWILQIARMSKIERLSLTGGEPFLVYPLLREVVGLAAKRGLQVGIVTSGFWATSLAAARRKLESLAGGDKLSLSLSVDRFHQESVPLKRVTNAVVAAHQVGIRHIKIKLGYLVSAKESQEQLAEQIGQVPVDFTIESQPIHRTGRAARQVSRDAFTRGDQDTSLADVPCCTANVPLITPEGDVYACCGTALLLKHPTPLLLGNLRTSALQEILDHSETNTILHFIRLYGPFQLFEHIGCQVQIEDCDADSLCALCLSLFATPDRVTALERRLQEPEWTEIERQIAVGRFLYRGEPAMLSRMPSRTSLRRG